MTLLELATYLATQGIGTVGTNLFYGYLPDSPNTCVCVQEYGGRSAPDERVFGQAEVAREYPRVQLLARGEPEDYTTPRVKIQDAYRAMSRVMVTTLSTVDYYTATPLQPPFPLSKDGTLRYLFAVNFELFKAVSAS